MVAKVAPLVIIVGETASGKSELAMSLAEKFNGEILCADSWTVYKGFDIGTAKPDQSEQNKIPHHLLDIADPKEGFSAPKFKSAAIIAIHDVHSRGKLPFLVGGTGLYIDSLVFDYSFMPEGDQQFREQLEALSLDKLRTYAIDNGLDLLQIDSHNKRRLVRYIQNGGHIPSKADVRQNTCILGITRDPDSLERRIINRVDKMFEQGLEKEVYGLAKKYGWDIEPMKGIGYREFKPYLDGRVSLGTVRENIMRATKQLAKKQRTWFKRNKYIQWIDDPSEADKIIQDFLNNQQQN
jgi:tRNA dimethylallyltransferase